MRFFIHILILACAVGAALSCRAIPQQAIQSPDVLPTDSIDTNDSSYLDYLQSLIDADTLDGAERERALYHLKVAMKNRPGTKASDFAIELRYGTVSSLHMFPMHKKTVLLFYDPDCDHCMETIAKLRTMSLEGLQVLAVDVAQNHDRWLETADILPAEWTAAFATEPVEDNEIYIFEEMPTMFLLDTDKTVILKNTSIDKLPGYIR